MVSKAVKWIAGRTRVEVSGGMTLRSVGPMAAAGADFISVGALTHSAPAMNISLNFSKIKTDVRRSGRKKKAKGS